MVENQRLTNTFGSNSNTLRQDSSGGLYENMNMARGPSPVAPMTNQVRSNVMSGQSFANKSPGRPASAKSMVGGVSDTGTRPTVQVKWTSPAPSATPVEPYRGVTFSPTIKKPEKIVTYGRPEDLMNDFTGNMNDRNLLDTLAQYQGIYDPQGYDMSQLDVQMVPDAEDPTGMRFLLTDSEGNIISRLRRYTIPGMAGYSQFTFEGGPMYSPIANDAINASNRTDSLLNVFGLGQTDGQYVGSGQSGDKEIIGPGPAQQDNGQGSIAGPGQDTGVAQEPVAPQPATTEPPKQEYRDIFQEDLYKPGSMASYVPEAFSSPRDAQNFYYATRARIINSNWSPSMKGIAMRELDAMMNSPEYPNAVIAGDAINSRYNPVIPSFNSLYDNGDRPYRAIMTP